MGNARPAAPHELVAAADIEAVLKVDVVSADVEGAAVGTVFPPHAVIERLRLELLAIAGIALPAQHQIATVDILVRRIELVFPAAEDISLEGDPVACRWRPVDPETAAKPVPGILGGRATGQRCAALVNPARISPIAELRTGLSGKAKRNDLLDGPGIDVDESARVSTRLCG